MEPVGSKGLPITVPQVYNLQCRILRSLGLIVVTDIYTDIHTYAYIYMHIYIYAPLHIEKQVDG